MKKWESNLTVLIILTLGIFFVFAVSLGNKEVRLSSPEDTCTIKLRSECLESNGEHILLGLSGETNAHVQDNSVYQNYPYVLCCNIGGGSSCDATASNRILRIYAPSPGNAANTHAEIPDLEQSNPYMRDICYGEVKCRGRASCLENEKEILSLSSRTNAHVGKPGDYNYKICCEVIRTCGEIGGEICNVENGFNCNEATITAYDGECCMGECVRETKTYWTDSGKQREINKTKVGQKVYLAWLNSNFYNKEVKFIIKEKTGVDKAVKEITGTTNFQGNVFGEWGITLADYEKTNEHSNYVFEVYIDNEKKSQSKGLKIILDLIDGIDSCGEYTIKHECQDNIEEVGVFNGEWDYYEDSCQRRENGIGCIWDDSKNICNQETVVEYHKDNSEICAETPVSCKYTQTKSGDCGKGDDDSIIITYAPVTGSGASCKTYTQTIDCSSKIKLPFFGVYSFIITLLIIMSIYIIRKKCKVSPLAEARG